MEDNFKKILSRLDVEYIEDVLNDNEFFVEWDGFPQSGTKEKWIEIILKNATIFESFIDDLFSDSNKKDRKLMCADLGIDSNSKAGELKKKILDKVNKTIDDRDIQNKINFLSSAFIVDELEDFLDDYSMSTTGKKERLVENIAINDFLVKKSMIEWKKKLQKEDIKTMCESLEINSEGNRENLLQRINDYVFKNESKKDVQNEPLKKINLDRNLDETHSKSHSIDNSSLVDKIVHEIESYRHPRKELTEYPYHVGLHGWLNHSFPKIGFELKKGSARPDIVVGNFAIEIKGPTHHKDLQTIADKINRYLQNFDKIIIVLFDIQVSETLLDDFLKGRKLYKDEDRIKFIVKRR